MKVNIQDATLVHRCEIIAGIDVVGDLAGDESDCCRAQDSARKLVRADTPRLLSKNLRDASFLSKSSKQRITMGLTPGVRIPQLFICATSLHSSIPIPAVQHTST